MAYITSCRRSDACGNGLLQVSRHHRAQVTDKPAKFGLGFGCINVLGVVPTPSSAEFEEPLNADEGVGTTDSPSLGDFPKR